MRKVKDTRAGKPQCLICGRDAIGDSWDIKDHGDDLTIWEYNTLFCRPEPTLRKLCEKHASQLDHFVGDLRPEWREDHSVMEKDITDEEYSFFINEKASRVLYDIANGGAGKECEYHACDAIAIKKENGFWVCGAHKRYAYDEFHFTSQVYNRVAEVVSRVFVNERSEYLRQEFQIQRPASTK